MEFPIDVGGHTIRFFIDSPTAQASANLNDRMSQVQACLSLLPREHARLVVEPIIVVDRFPGGRERGGGFFPPAGSGRGSSTESWLTTGAARNTGVPPDDILGRVGGREGTGIIGITSFSFLRDANWGGGHKAFEFTLLHEVGHSVDFHSGLIPPASLEGREGNGPYQGQTYPGGSVGELAAEAYSRFFLCPASMCRGGHGTPPCLRPDGGFASGRCPTQRRCSARLQRDLMNTPAFRMAHVVFPLAATDAAREASESHTPRRASGAARGPLDVACEYFSEEGLSPRAGWRRPGPFGTSTT